MPAPKRITDPETRGYCEAALAAARRSRDDNKRACETLTRITNATIRDAANVAHANGMSLDEIAAHLGISRAYLTDHYLGDA